MSGEPVYITSDSEDELHLPLNREHVLHRKPITDEVVPDSEGESEPLPLVPHISPRQQYQDQSKANQTSLSAVHKRKESELNENPQEIPKTKKMKPAKKGIILSDDEIDAPNPPVPNTEVSETSLQPQCLPPRPRPKPRPKARPKKLTGGSEESSSTSSPSHPQPIPKSPPQLQPQPHLESRSQTPPKLLPQPYLESRAQSPPQPQPVLKTIPQLQQEPPRDLSGDQIPPSNQHQPSIHAEKSQIPKPKPKSKAGEQKRQEKENSPLSPKDTSSTSAVSPANNNTSPPLKDTSRTKPASTPAKPSLSTTTTSNKKNRPLSDILRQLNKSGPPRFSPAVSRRFLSRIAPLHPNRHEPPPSPPRVIPKKTKKEIKMEEQWEEELQDTIPDWCQLTEEERARYRKEKRDWELGLCED